MTKTIGRADLIAALGEQTRLPRTDCANLLESVMNEITDTLTSGEKVKLNGFATFRPHQKHARVGLNPKTKEKVPIPPRKVVVFRPSPGLKAKINRAGD